MFIQQNRCASDAIQRHTIIWHDGGLIGHNCQEHTGADFPPPMNPSMPRILSKNENISILMAVGMGWSLQIPCSRVITRAKVRPLAPLAPFLLNSNSKSSIVQVTTTAYIYVDLIFQQFMTSSDDKIFQTQKRYSPTKLLRARNRCLSNI